MDLYQGKLLIILDFLTHNDEMLNLSVLYKVNEWLMDNKLKEETYKRVKMVRYMKACCCPPTSSMYHGESRFPYYIGDYTWWWPARMPLLRDSSHESRGDNRVVWCVSILQRGQYGDVCVFCGIYWWCWCSILLSFCEYGGVYVSLSYGRSLLLSHTCTWLTLVHTLCTASGNIIRFYEQQYQSFSGCA